MKRTIATVLVSFAAGAGIAQATDLLSPVPAPVAPSANTQLAPAPAHELKNFSPAQSLAPLVKKLQPAVVNIQVKHKVARRSMPMSPFFSPFFDSPGARGGPEYRVQTGQGSGFIISSDGYLLTNNHVVAKAEEVTVKLADEREFVGTVVGTDSRIDIALVKIESEEALPFVELGPSKIMEVGDWVVAIGNPFGLSHTVTAGIVSAKGRIIGAGPYDDFIQTDASINPGNSGGPLFNLNGEVIGINTAINAAGQGIGFAVPTDMVSPFLDDLKANGKISRGWLGIALQNLDEELSASLGEEDGVLVSQVYPNQPAAEAGLKSGDIITQLGGEKVENSSTLIRNIGRHPAGDSVDIQIKRNGKSKTLAVVLGERPTEEALRKASFQPQSPVQTGKLGIILGQEDGRPGITIKSLQAGSPAASRLESNDRILKVNGLSVQGAEDLERGLRRSKEHAIFVVLRGQTQIWVAVPIDQ